MTTEFKVIAGLDIGNGYVKGTTKCTGDTLSIDLPSCTAYVVNPVDVPVDPSRIDNFMDDIFNQMDLSFSTKTITTTGRRLFGRRGVESGKSLENFVIDSNMSKAEQELSAILVLGCIAGTALHDYWKANNALPDELVQVHTVVSLALPINEYKKYREFFADKFMKDTHFVEFHNFDKAIRMEIIFDDVEVLAEGASAQFAILDKGEPLMQMMLEDVRSHGMTLPGITAADILAATGTVGIDIGEGTVNFPVFTQGKFNTDASITLGKGYGTVLADACEPLTAKHIPFTNRKALAEFLNQKPNALTKGKREMVQAVVNSEAENLVREIVSSFVRVLDRSNGLIQVAYVYGGGASPLKPLLYDALIEASKPFCGGSEFPILYLDSKYSRYLNKQGLFSIAEQFANMKQK